MGSATGLQVTRSKLHQPELVNALWSTCEHSFIELMKVGVRLSLGVPLLNDRQNTIDQSLLRGYVFWCRLEKRSIVIIASWVYQITLVCFFQTGGWRKVL